MVQKIKSGSPFGHKTTILRCYCYVLLHAPPSSGVALCNGVFRPSFGHVLALISLEEKVIERNFKFIRNIPPLARETNIPIL